MSWPSPPIGSSRAAAWFRKLVDACKSETLLPGRGYRKRPAPGGRGYTLEIIPPPIATPAAAGGFTPRGKWNSTDTYEKGDVAWLDCEYYFASSRSWNQRQFYLYIGDDPRAGNSNYPIVGYKINFIEWDPNSDMENHGSHWLPIGLWVDTGDLMNCAANGEDVTTATITYDPAPPQTPPWP